MICDPWRDPHQPGDRVDTNPRGRTRVPLAALRLPAQTPNHSDHAATAGS